MGSKGVQNGVLREHLQKSSLLLADFLTEMGSFGPRYAYKVWSPGKIWFVNYGQKGASKLPKIAFSAYKS